MEFRRRTVLAALGALGTTGCASAPRETTSSDAETEDSRMTDRTPRHVNSDGELTSDVNNESVSTEEARITAESSTTFHVPTDFDTLADALDVLGGEQIRAGRNAIINLETGHEITEPILLEDGDWGHITIQSEDATVPVSSSIDTSSHVIEAYRATLPLIDTTIDCQGNGEDGIWVRESNVKFTNGSGIINAALNNLNLTGSRADAWSGTFTGAGQSLSPSDVGPAGGPDGRAIQASYGSVVNAGWADVSGSLSGVQSNQSIVSFRNGTADNIDAVMFAANSGILDAWGATGTNLGYLGAWASMNSLVTLRGAELDGISDTTSNYTAGIGVLSRRGSSVVADRGNLTNIANYTFAVEKSGELSAIDLSSGDHTILGAFSESDESWVDVVPGQWTTGGIIINDDVPDANYSERDHALHVTLSDPQSVTAGNSPKVAFDNAVADPFGNWDAGNRTWTVPFDGKYRVSARVTLDNLNSGDKIEVYAGRNSSIDDVGTVREIDYAGGSIETFSASAKSLVLNAGDEIRVAVTNEDSDCQIRALDSGTYLQIENVTYW